MKASHSFFTTKTLQFISMNLVKYGSDPTSFWKIWQCGSIWKSILYWIKYNL